MGIQMPQESGWTPSVWGWEGKCGRPSFPSFLALLAIGVEAAFAHLVPEWMHKLGVLDQSFCVPVPAPSPSSGLQPAYKTGMLPSTPGELFSSGGGREEGNGAINSPSRPCSVHLPWRQPLGTDDSFVSMGNSRATLSVRGVFLLHKHMNRI